MVDFGFWTAEADFGFWPPAADFEFWPLLALFWILVTTRFFKFIIYLYFLAENECNVVTRVQITISARAAKFCLF